ncbi:MAG: hypothetical protein AB7F89_20265 [Pirellulaceae bacterium]
MTSPLQIKSAPWEPDPTCQRVTYETLGGEELYTRIQAPPGRVEAALAERARARATATRTNRDRLRLAGGIGLVLLLLVGMVIVHG